MLQKIKTDGLAIALYVLSAPAAQAMLIDFEFDVCFAAGDLIGQTFTGTVILDGVTGSGIETFTPVVRAGGRQLVDLHIDILGDVFNAADDDRYPNFPVVRFFDGEPLIFSYLGMLLDGTILFFVVDTNAALNQVVYTAPVPRRSAQTRSCGFNVLMSMASQSPIRSRC